MGHSFIKQPFIKLTIITEKTVLKGTIKIIEANAASGYVVLPVQDKGTWSVSALERPARADDFSDVKIEIITTTRVIAEKIADEVAEKYFDNYSGLVYLDTVEVLHIHTP